MRTEAGVFENPIHYSRREFKEVLWAQAWTCFWCGKIITERSARPDHLWPTSRGGSDRIENIVATCDDCNCLKGNRTAEEFIRDRPAFFHNISEISTGVSLEEKNEPGLLKRMRRESEETSWAWRNPA